MNRRNGLGYFVSLGLVFALACGGTDLEPVPDGQTGGSGGTGTAGSSGAGTGGSAATGTGGSAGTGTGGSAGTGTVSDLTGTWDILGTPVNDIAVSGLMVLDDKQLSVSTSDFKFELVTGSSPTLGWDYQGESVAIDAENTPESYLLGAVPLSLGGSWRLSQGNGSCDMSLSNAAGIAANCSGVEPVGHLPGLNGVMTGARVSQRASIFGDLGGVWEFSDDNASWSCSATVEANKISADCQGLSDRLSGSVNIEFGDGIASGSTSEGLEFSATRR